MKPQISVDDSQFGNRFPRRSSSTCSVFVNLTSASPRWSRHAPIEEEVRNSGQPTSGQLLSLLMKFVGNYYQPRMSLKANDFLEGPIESTLCSGKSCFTAAMLL